MDERFKVLVQAAIDIQKSQNAVNAQIKQIQEKANKLQLDVVVDTKSAKQAIKEVEKIKKQELSAINARLRADGAGGRFQAYLKNLKPEALKKYTNEINGIANAFKNVESQSDLTHANAQLNKFKGTMRETGMEGRTFFGEFKNSLAKFGQWLFVGTILMQAIRGVRSIIDNVHKLDTAMTNLKKVTDETDATYSRFVDNASKSAKRLGVTITDLVESTADFSRLGYSLAEASKLAESATIYSNVGDIGIEQGTESIISTLKGFNIEADKSIDVIDKFNEVGNNFAISSEGIGEALKRSASALASANNDLDQSIALITAGNTVVQDAEAVGRLCPAA